MTIVASKRRGIKINIVVIVLAANGCDLTVAKSQLHTIEYYSSVERNNYWCYNTMGESQKHAESEKSLGAQENIPLWFQLYEILE